jgi:carbon starvation protein
MHALPLMVVALCVLAVAYRYYSAFIAARVLVLDDARVTPAHRLNDGHNYVPTNRWVLFGHHFAAITGAGPLVGPVLAAQFGFLPGYLWILVGVVLGGAVHDFVVLAGSIRHDGKSLAQIVRAEVGPTAGTIAGFSILFIVTLAIAAMARIVVNTLADSAWGTFTIAATIPIALLMGLHMSWRKASGIREASIAGVILLFAAVWGGRVVADSPRWAHAFLLSDHQLTMAIAVYGFFASVLPVWMLLLPRDYLSAYLKLGTIACLILGVMIVNPAVQFPAISQFTHGGPVVPGSLFPFVFITVACGAISGFHGLIGSGTTPKMIDRESDARFIGYGAMLCEAVVGIVALMAVCALNPADYFAMNAAPDKFAAMGLSLDELPELSRDIGERLEGRAGGAVSLAVGIAKIFRSLPGFRTLVAYWYHFAIMFEALFVLTTVDSGTRVARFLVQEFFGRWSPEAGKTSSAAGAIAATTVVVGGWTYLVWTGSVTTLWPMLGISNQLLACIALCTCTTMLVNRGQLRFAWVTLIPLVFVGIATQTAGVELIHNAFLPKIRSHVPAFQVQGWVLASLCILCMTAMLAILLESIPRWIRAVRGEVLPAPGATSPT